MKEGIKIKIFPILFLFLISCATYQNKVTVSRSLIKGGNVSGALENLKKLAEEESRDQLVHLLDYGTALQIAGQYKESNEVFLKADKLTDLNDFHSVSNITAATFGSETMIQYKGESYEKVLINAYLAINYLMLGLPDDALVECRRLNEKLSAMRLDGRQPYELNPFAKYVSALIWESERKYDDSYIEYEESYKLDSMNPLLPADLIRSAKLARRDDSYKKWKKEFPEIKEEDSWYDKSLGEIVIIYQQGWGPEKHMAPGQYRFPALYPVRSQTQNIKAIIEQKSESVSVPVYDLERIAIKTLNEDYGALVARRIGGVAAKAVLADQIRQKNEALGTLAWIAMNLADQADLRQWSTLPQTFQIVRVRLKPGEYNIKLIGQDSAGSATGEFREISLKVSQGKKTFYSFRSLK